MKIVFCSSEAVPFAKTGGLADVAGALPLALEKLGQEVILVMPGYKKVSECQSVRVTKLHNQRVLAAGLDVSIATIGKKIKVYFIENESYYNRPGLYSYSLGDYTDNLERFTFFCKKTLELLKKISFRADIIHCNDWQTALIPAYLKQYKGDVFYKHTKTVLTIHNAAYQGLFAKEKFPVLGLDDSFWGIDGFEFHDKISLLKGGVISADMVNTVSRGYKQELLTEEFACGLEGVYRKRSHDFYGVLNGLDYSFWNPRKDKYLFKKYGPLDLKSKGENKKYLQKEGSLTIDKDIPLLGFVGRLVEQKGIDLLLDVIKDVSKLGAQLVILGVGDIKYYNILKNIAGSIGKGVFSLHLDFNEALAHRIYASSDMFLMPSRFEPCGLGQMISLRYGTIPIVSKVGGLADTIFEFNPQTKEGNGFVFTHYNKESFLSAIKRAVELYKTKKIIWKKLVKKTMGQDFSWEKSGKEYLELYRKVVSRE